MSNATFETKSGFTWKFDERHIIGEAIPRRLDCGQRIGVSEGVVLAYTLSARCSGSSGIFPERYSTGNACKDAECFLFNLYFELACRLQNERVVDYFIIEEMRNKEKDAIIGHRFFVGVGKHSAKYTRMGDEGEEDSSNQNNDEDVSLSPDESNNEGQNADNSSVNDNMSKTDKILLTIDSVFKSMFYTAGKNGKEKTKKGKGGRGGKNSNQERGVQNDEKLYRYHNALRRYMLHMADCEHENTHRHIMSNKLSANNLVGKQTANSYTIADLGAVRLFKLITCILADDLFKGDRRYMFNTDDDGEHTYFEEYDKMQRIALNYFEENAVLGKLEEHSGITFPECEVEDGSSDVVFRTMNVSVTHLKLDTLQLLEAPGNAYDDFMKRQSVKPCRQKQIQLSSGNLKYLSSAHSVFSFLNPSLTDAIDTDRNRLDYDSDDDHASNIRILAKPSAHFDAAALKAGTTCSTLGSATDPLVKKKMYAYENPRDIAQEMKLNDIDVARLKNLQTNLGDLLRQQTLYKLKIKEFEDKVSQFEDDHDKIQELHVQMTSLMDKNMSQNRKIKALRYDIENMACTVAEKAISRAFAAAKVEDTEKLSEAQIACFNQRLIFSKMDLNETLSDIDRNLSPFANWMNYLTMGLDQCFGVHTHHTQALFVIASGKTAFIADSVMRTHVLQSGPPEAGKDFIRETAQKLSPKGVYQTKSSTTEAARVDMERRLETGMVFCYSETPSWLSDQAAGQYDLMVESMKKACTECTIERKKFVKYQNSNGDEEFYATNVRVDAKCAMIVNSNEAGTSNASHKKIGATSHSQDALLSRFARLPQSVPRRKWDNIQDGDKLAENVDTRLYTAHSSHNQNAQPLELALKKLTKASHQNVGLHCVLNFLITLNAIPSVDLTAFDLMKQRVSSILKNYNKIRDTSRYTQQARNFAYVLSMDDWIVRHFMLPGGTFVNNGNSYMSSERQGSSQQQQQSETEETGEDYGTVDSRTQLSVASLVRAAHRCRICCTEEVALFAWQMMLSTGVVSHSIISFISKVLIHYIQHYSDEQGKSVSVNEPPLSILQFGKPEFASSKADQLASEHKDMVGAKRSDFEEFTKYYYKVEDADGDVSETAVLDSLCCKLEAHNEEYAVMDTKYSSSQMFEALLKLIHDRSSAHSVPWTPELEFRRKDLDGNPVTIFGCTSFVDHLFKYLLHVNVNFDDQGESLINPDAPECRMPSSVGMDDFKNIVKFCMQKSFDETREGCSLLYENSESIKLFMNVYMEAVNAEIDANYDRSELFFRVCATTLQRVLNGEYNAYSEWKGALLTIEIVQQFDKKHVFMPHWDEESC